MFIINQKLAHMNTQNWGKLDSWWATKMRKAHEKISHATGVLNAISFSEEEIQEQIKLQRDSVTVLNPGIPNNINFMISH